MLKRLVAPVLAALLVGCGGGGGGGGSSDSGSTPITVDADAAYTGKRTEAQLTPTNSMEFISPSSRLKPPSLDGQIYLRY
ncbi:MAG: hypothetical protein WAQ53_06995 [Thiofilum sp.]|uniref:hypothetical protein n=1 Tax=Thiofilum sp. TaxID=2212733 RepID=UPI0025FE1C38|nr:hypothetical protein [Thiofilum sp.]MBK8455115.1 hypothetical protein [Thiofilum sp.]